MQNKKRQDMLKKTNSKIVYLDTQESELMYELLIKTNEVFKDLTKNAGMGKLEFDEALEIREKFKNMMIKTSDVLSFISSKNDKEYAEPFVISKLRNDIVNKGE